MLFASIEKPIELTHLTRGSTHHAHDVRHAAWCAQWEHTLIVMAAEPQWPGGVGHYPFSPNWK